MLVWDLFKKYLFSKRSGALVKTIAWISLISVAIGVSALILVTSIMNGFNQTIRSRMFGVEPHVVIESVGLGEEGRFELQERERQIRQDANVVAATVVQKQDVIIRTLEGLFGGGVAKGYRAKELTDLFYRIEKLNTKSSDLNRPEVIHTELNEGEVILGVDLARSLEVYEGDEIFLIPPEALLLPPGEAPRIQKAKVVSIVYSRLAEVDSKQIFYSQESGLPFLKTSAGLKSELEIRLKDPHKVKEWVGALKKNSPEILLNTWETRNEALFFALKLEKISMTTFLGLAVLITGFSILSALVLLISQKKSDYGILLAMGLSVVDGQKLFSGIGFLLAGIGIASGVVIGTSLSLYLQFFPPDVLPSIYYDSTIPAVVNPVTLLVIVFVSISLAWLGTTLSARSLLKMTPAEALK
jgi:lipoprotein-releasing system permease protein